MRALVVGGTGPTGPFVVEGLVARGYDVTIFHRGSHEIDAQPPVEHIHGDPHRKESIDRDIGARSFDVVVAMYGRTRHVADAMAGRCGQFIAIGGTPVYRGFLDPDCTNPRGMPIGATEMAHLAVEDGEANSPTHYSHLVYLTEQSVFALHDKGAFAATYFRYPRLYGARQINPVEWSVVKRILDGRDWMILPDGGLTILSRCAAPNAARFVLLAVDNSNVAAGQAYNCADDDQYTWRQWMEMIVEYLDGHLQMLSVPDLLASPARALLPMQRSSDHGLVSTTKAKMDLGYKDVVAARNALHDTVDWYIENPPAAGEFSSFADRFDYRAEDRLIAAYARLTREFIREQDVESVNQYPYR
jgi:nucleoside-diphosphate-sugar epimerase